MLVLTREKNESIHIDGDIVITIVEIRGNKVRVGIQAPRSTSVKRDELLSPEERKKPFEPRTRSGKPKAAARTDLKGGL